MSKCPSLITVQGEADTFQDPMRRVVQRSKVSLEYKSNPHRISSFRCHVDGGAQRVLNRRKKNLKNLGYGDRKSNMVKMRKAKSILRWSIYKHSQRNIFHVILLRSFISCHSRIHVFFTRLLTFNFSLWASVGMTRKIGKSQISCFGLGFVNDDFSKSHDAPSR